MQQFQLTDADRTTSTRHKDYSQNGCTHVMCFVCNDQFQLFDADRTTSALTATTNVAMPSNLYVNMTLNVHRNHKVY